MSPNEPGSGNLPARDSVPTIGRRYLDAVDVIRGRAIAVTPDRFRALELEQSTMRMEWQDVQEKINTWAARVAKREQRALKRLAEAQDSQESEQMNGQSALSALLSSGPAMPE